MALAAASDETAAMTHAEGVVGGRRRRRRGRCDNGAGGSGTRRWARSWPWTRSAGMFRVVAVRGVPAVALQPMRFIASLLAERHAQTTTIIMEPRPSFSPSL